MSGNREWKLKLYRRYFEQHLGRGRELDRSKLRKEAEVFWKRYEDFAPASKNEPILDLGCGYGTALLAFETKGYTDVSGVDISRQQVSLARSMGLDNVRRRDLLEFLRHTDRKYAAVLCIDVLEHFRRPQVIQILGEVYDRLLPGGRIIIQTPNGNSPFASRMRYRDLTHEFCFTPASLSQSLLSVGFREPIVRDISPIVHGVASAVRYVGWRTIRVILSAYLTIETGVLKQHIVSQNLMACAVKPD